MKLEIRKVKDHWWNLPWRLYELTEYRDIFLGCAATKLGINCELERQIKRITHGEPKVIYREPITLWETENDRH